MAIIRGLIEPVPASKLLPVQQRLRAITALHEPGCAPPDFDHPITKAMVSQLPKLPYSALEAVRAKLMQHDGTWLSNARDVDGWLRLVNAELQSRDRLRERAGESLIELLTKGSRP